jgi:hypothetical protein
MNLPKKRAALGVVAGVVLVIGLVAYSSSQTPPLNSGGRTASTTDSMGLKLALSSNAARVFTNQRISVALFSNLAAQVDFNPSLEYYSSGTWVAATSGTSSNNGQVVSTIGMTFICLPPLESRFSSSYALTGQKVTTDAGDKG